AGNACVPPSRGHTARLAPLAPSLVNRLDDGLQIIAVRPIGVVRLELAHVADVPDVVAGPGSFGILPTQLAAADLLAQGHRFQHGTMAVAAAASVVHFARPRV